MLVLLSRSQVLDFAGLRELAVSAKDQSWRDALILLAFGFAFSYIASAPIYVMHVHRYRLALSTGTSYWSRLATILIFFASIAILGGVLAYRFEFQSNAAWLIAVVVAPQFVLVFRSWLDQKQGTAFYRALAAARADRAGWTAEYVESYKHAREHANAYAIVLLCVALCACLSGAATLIQAGLLLALWLSPAVLSWFTAIALERELAK